MHMAEWLNGLENLYDDVMSVVDDFLTTWIQVL